VAWALWRYSGTRLALKFWHETCKGKLGTGIAMQKPCQSIRIIVSTNIVVAQHLQGQNGVTL